MLELETKITLNKETINASNLAGRFSERDLRTIGNLVFEGFQRDKFSRMKWEKRTQAAMDLAMQIQKDKNFPWAGCSNVAFPLITIATLQFHSRAYPSIISGTDLVRYRVVGDDQGGEEAARARRVGEHMSYQLLEEDEAWEEQHDRMLINIPIVGCAFKKTYFSGLRGHNVSELVLAQDLVLDYYAKDVHTCGRKTEIIQKYRNELHEGIMSETFLDVREEVWYQSYAVPYRDSTSPKVDARHGTFESSPDDDTPFTLLEQHCWFDFDRDGYKEPYIVTIEANTQTVLRIVARVDRLEDIEKNVRGEIVRINATEYYTKYGFIPSPDGGVYDIGFGVLLGPLNESVNSLLNQLIDAGTMSNSAGGFLGRGAKIRGGVYTFAPLEWKRVDSTGDDLRKSIFPLPVREPSMVLFQLLSLLITYTNRISGTTETMLGENPGQNTPAQTTQVMVEQGMKIYNAIFKRVWRSMKEEFRKLYILNAIYLPGEALFGPGGQKAIREDYLGDPKRICPVADPNVTSEQQRVALALAVKQSAMTTPGYDMGAVERNYLQALHVDGIDVLFPGPENMQPAPNPQAELEAAKLHLKQLDIESKQQMFLANLFEQRRLNSAKILEMEAQTAKIFEEAGSVKTEQQIAAFNAAIGAMKTHDESLRAQIELMMQGMEKGNESNGKTTDGAGMGGVAGPSGDISVAQRPSFLEGAGQGAMGGGGVY